MYVNPKIDLPLVLFVKLLFLILFIVSVKPLSVGVSLSFETGT